MVTVRPPALRTLAAGLLALLCACTGGEPGARERGRGLLVIAVDALRRDHLELYGSDRETMPFLSRLSRQAIVFEDVWSPGASLEAAHVALLTGCDPLVAVSPLIPGGNGASLRPALPWQVPESVPHLALEFLAQGWSTGAFLDHPSLSEVSGFGVGFHHFEASPGSPQQSGLEVLSEELLDWAGDLRAGRDWFGYLHLHDLERLWQQSLDERLLEFRPRPELDYIPPRARVDPMFHAVTVERRSPVQRSLGEYEAHYDSALRRLDRGLEELWGRLQEQGLLERTTVVLVGSYGFGFGEAGLLVDTGVLAEVDLRVPLLVRPAPELGLPTGRRVDALLSLVDLAPTLLGVGGLQPPPGLHGFPFNGLMAGGTEPVREHAFALAALHPGFAVINSEALFTSSVPGQNSVNLAESWFGQRSPANPRIEGLFRRGERLRPGGRLDGLPDPELADRLRSVGQAWYRDIELLREALHLYRWDPAARDPEVLDALRAKGLLGQAF